MADVFTKSKRSEVMRLIRSSGNKNTEMRLVALMRERGIKGWRRQISLPLSAPRLQVPAKMAQGRVRPDFVFRRERVAVFVDGCFWHGCPRHATRPMGNRKFWDAKFARNKERDLKVTRALRRAGWTVVRIWECALGKKRQAATMTRLMRALAK